MSKILWQAGQKSVQNANVTKFITYVNESYQLDLKNYPDLYDWSIHKIENFWESVWTFCGIKASQTYSSVADDLTKMPGTKWFENAKLNFAENLLSRRDSHTALIFHNEQGQHRTLSYAQLYEQVLRLAKALRHAGVTQGDVVAAYMPNCPETVIAMLATTSIGALFSSCSPDFGPEGLLDRFGQIKPKVLFTCDGQFYNGKAHDSLDKLKKVIPALTSLEKVILVPYLNEKIKHSELPNTVLYEDFLIDASDIVFEQLPFDHPIYITYSSGTTGIPKCIVHGAGGTLIQHLKEFILHTDLTKDDVIFYYTTCGWMMWNWLVSSLAVGATVVLYDGAPMKPNVDSLIDLIDEDNITVFGTSAKYISSLEKETVQPNKTHQLTSLRCILSTGSPLLPASFDYVYENVKKDLCLASISGGTDILSCFALGNPLLPVYRGELQCRGLGMKVEVFNDAGKSVQNQKGELVCTAPFPSMPVSFWNDPDHKKYKAAYFEKFPAVWTQGDYAELTPHGGMIIHGRSDTVLNPGGVRIGTAEIYRQVEKVIEVVDSVVTSQQWQDDERIILFVKLQNDLVLNEELVRKIKKIIRDNASPRHVPAKVIQVNDIPRTVSGKIVESAVRDVIHHREVKNVNALENPEALEEYKNLLLNT